MRPVAPRALCLLFALNACGGDPPTDAPGTTIDAPCESPLDLAFTPDTGDVDEAYVCYGFDSARFSASTIGAVRWSMPSGGPYLVHHAIVYALPGEYPDGPVVCDGMPAGAVPLHVWSPGGDDLALPSDTGLALPLGTERFIVEAHLKRSGEGAAVDGRVRICTGPSSPVHTAAMMGTGAPVPAIRPMHEETSSGTCALAEDLHLFSVWPHMHLVGQEITADLLRVGGDATPLVDVPSWNFHRQRTYPLDVDAKAGDQIRVGCIWNNPGSEYVLPGPKTEDEMCNAAFVAWPAESAFCLGSP